MRERGALPTSTRSSSGARTAAASRAVPSGTWPTCCSWASCVDSVCQWLILGASYFGAALRAGGRLIGIHSHGKDPGIEIIDQVWPGDDPFKTDRYAILRQVKHELGAAARHYNFNASSDARSIFRYHMHTLPDEVSGPIGTSTLFAAWNAAIYVAQVEDVRLSEVVRDGRYLEATDRVLKKYGGLWFNDETYVISRRRAQA